MTQMDKISGQMILLLFRQVSYAIFDIFETRDQTIIQPEFLASASALAIYELPNSIIQ